MVDGEVGSDTRLVAGELERELSYRNMQVNKLCVIETTEGNMTHLIGADGSTGKGRSGDVIAAPSAFVRGNVVARTGGNTMGRRGDDVDDIN
jgi:hypothetical protein